MWLHQPDESANFELAMKLHTSMAMAVRPVDSAQRAVADADVVLLTGASPCPWPRCARAPTSRFSAPKRSLARR